MNGHIIRGTPICVDYWLWTPQQQFIHFLSHLHADHTVNLKSTFCEPIYTSPFNAWLVKRWFKVDPKLVMSLELKHPHVIFHQPTGTNFTVTLLDANHCPGSVMFVFQGSFGNIVYTGDFRYNPDVLEHPMLKSLIENEVIHRLYLDNTFAAEHCEFPSRHRALQDVIEIIREHPDHNILIGVRKLGKEEALQAIALKFKEKLWVSRERLIILSFLKCEDVFTTDENEARIFAKEIHQITSSYITRLQEEKGPVIAILLTALYSVMPPDARYSPKKTISSVHHVPYSDHSCHSELLTFVSKLKPQEIHPIVVSNAENEKNNALSRKKNNLSGFLSMSFTWRNSVIPQSILKFCKNKTGRDCKISDLGRDTVRGVVFSHLFNEDESRSSQSDENGSRKLKCNKQSISCVTKSSKFIDHRNSQVSKITSLKHDFPFYTERFLSVSEEKCCAMSDEDSTQISSDSLAMEEEKNNLEDDLSNVDNNFMEVIEESQIINSQDISGESNQIEAGEDGIPPVNIIYDNAVIDIPKNVLGANNKHCLSPKLKQKCNALSTPIPSINNEKLLYTVHNLSTLSKKANNVPEVNQETNISKINPQTENIFPTESLSLAKADVIETAEPNKNNQSFEGCTTSYPFRKRPKKRVRFSEKLCHFFGTAYDSDSEGFCETIPPIPNYNHETDSSHLHAKEGVNTNKNSSNIQTESFLHSFSDIAQKIDLRQNESKETLKTLFNDFDRKVSKWKESILEADKYRKENALLKERSTESIHSTTSDINFRSTHQGCQYNSALTIWSDIDFESIFKNIIKK